MKRPATVAGLPLPRQNGRCAICAAHLDDPRDGSLKLLTRADGKQAFALICREERACCERRKALGGEMPREEE